MALSGTQLTRNSSKSSDAVRPKASIDKKVPQIGRCSNSSPARSFARLLISLNKKQFTGILVLDAGECRTILYFDEGMCVFAELGLPEHALGEFLVQQGLISEKQHAQLISRVAENLLDRKPILVGELLSDLGILTQEEISLALRQQLKEKLISCFEWESLLFQLRPGKNWLKKISPIPAVSLGEILLEAIHRHYHALSFEKLCTANGNKYPYFVEPLEKAAALLNLSDRDIRSIKLLTGGNTLNRFLEICTLTYEEAVLFISALWFIGELRFSQTPVNRMTTLFRETSSAKCSSDPWRTAPQSLVPSNSNTKESLSSSAIQAVEPPQQLIFGQTPRLAKRSDAAPSYRSHHKVPLANQRSPLTKKIQDATEAKPNVQSQMAYTIGKKLLLSGRIKEASYQFQIAIYLDPHEDIFQLLFAWTEFLLATDEETRSKCKTKTRGLAEKVLSNNQDFAKAHSILGHMFLSDKQKDEALHHFRLAESLSASNSNEF